MADFAHASPRAAPPIATAIKLARVPSAPSKAKQAVKQAARHAPDRHTTAITDWSCSDEVGGASPPQPATPAIAPDEVRPPASAECCSRKD